MTKPLHPDEIEIDLSVVQRLVDKYLPDLAHHSLRPLGSTGTDNWLFRLGEQFAVRLPRRPSAAISMMREASFLHQIAEHLPQPIPTIKFVGQPDAIFAWPWTVIEWIEGNVVPRGAEDGREALATDLGKFVCALAKQDILNGPRAKLTERGSLLASRDALTRTSARAVSDLVDVDQVLAIWQRDSSAPAWDRPPAWFHGDLWGGNILQDQGRLCGIIDFGSFGVGDPAVDLTPAWSLFKGKSRAAFLDASGCDAASRHRGRAWALSIALVQLPYYQESDPALCAGALGVVNEVIADQLI